MKRGDFSYHTQSHMSLAKYNKQSLESRVDSISKELMNTKPNVKMYVNPKSQQNLKKIKSDEELRKQNKLYEY